jgi:hypothetical protein
MSLRRRLELILGLLTGIVGIIGLTVGTSLQHECVAAAATGQDTCSTTFAPAALVFRSEPGAWVVASVLVFALASVAAGVVIHSHVGNNAGRVILWIATGVLFAGTIATMASIGLNVAPALALALLTSWVAGGATV